MIAIVYVAHVHLLINSHAAFICYFKYSSIIFHDSIHYMVVILSSQ